MKRRRKIPFSDFVITKNYQFYLFFSQIFLLHAEYIVAHPPLTGLIRLGGAAYLTFFLTPPPPQHQREETTPDTKLDFVQFQFQKSDYEILEVCAPQILVGGASGWFWTFMSA